MCVCVCICCTKLKIPIHWHLIVSNNIESYKKEFTNNDKTNLKCPFCNNFLKSKAFLNEHVGKFHIDTKTFPMRNTYLISYQILHPKLLWQRLCKPHILKSFQILQQSKNCSRQHHFPTINGKEYKKENELSFPQL